MFLEVVTVLLLVAVLALAGVVWWLVRARDGFVRRAYGEAEASAERRFGVWKEQEFSAQRGQLLEVARGEAALMLEAWKVSAEGEIRQDAILRSQSTTLGKVSEHMAPYMPDFPWNPKDARFIGSPIDFVVFDGLDDGLVQEVIFLEVKTASSGLSTRQRQIRDVIQAGRVVWHEMRIGG